MLLKKYNVLFLKKEEVVLSGQNQPFNTTFTDEQLMKINIKVLIITLS